MKQYFEKFESVTEFIHTIDTRKVRESFEDKQHSQTKDFEFTETFSYEEANNLFLYGDKKNADKLNEALRKIKAQGKGNETRNSLYNSPCGFMPIVPKVLAGDPQNMLAIKKQTYQSTKVLNVVYNTTVHGSVKKENILNVAAKIANVIASLEKNGYRINLYVFFAAKDCYKGKTEASCLIKVKDSGKYLDTLRIAYPLVNSSFLRRHLFAYLERLPEYVLEYNYGYVAGDDNAQKYIPLQKYSYLSYYLCSGKTEQEITKMIESAK